MQISTKIRTAVPAVIALGIACLSALNAGAAPAPKSPPPTSTGLASDDLFLNPARAAHRLDEFVYTSQERIVEATEKVARLRRAMAEQSLDGIVIATERNLNWITAGGKDTVVFAQRETPVKLLITADRLYLIANNIEGPRVSTEEVGGLGYEWIGYQWYEAESKALAPLIRGKRIAFDLPEANVTYGGGTDIPAKRGKKPQPVPGLFDFAQVYFPVTQGEIKKYRWLGRKTEEVLEQVAQVVRPGMTERDVQYLLERELWYWDIFPTVVLTAVDERFKNYRHPVVIGATLKNYVALNVCTRRWGLVISTTRMLHFGEPTAALAKAWEEGPKVCAAMWAATKPGNSFGDVVDAAKKAYGDVGFPDEWKLHHQGGPILTLERLDLVNPGDKRKITPGMVFAWNPTVQGSKFEDTVLVNADGSLESLSPALKWPTVTVTAGGTAYKIPTLLVRPVP